MEQISATAAPTGEGGLIRNRSLPLSHLVGMRKELGRHLGRSGIVERLVEGVNERARVEENGEPALAEQTLKLAAARVETIAMPVSHQGRDRQQGALRDGQNRGADAGVVVVLGG